MSERGQDRGPLRASVRLERPCAWRGSSLLITDDHGTCGSDALSGFYVREARHLCELRLTVDGTAPWTCEQARSAADRLSFVYVHPELTRFGGGGSGASTDETTVDEHGVPHRALDMRLGYRVEVDQLVANLVVTNRSRQQVAVEVAWRFAADYADLLEANDDRRQQEAPVTATAGDDGVHLGYGHPRLPFETWLRLTSPGPRAASADRLSTRLDLAPGAAAEVVLTVEAHDPDRPLDPAARRARMAAHDAWRDGLTRVEVPGNPLAQRILERSIGDLAAFPLLEGAPEEWLALQAGVPLYPAFFGRDALTAGWQAALLDGGSMLDAALTRLAGLQSDRVFDWRDEEPGRIPYQVRSGPLARLGLNPYSAYYADFASPLMFVIALANLWAWTGDRERVQRHLPAARRILDWARTFGDRDGDGFLEYLTRSSMGTKNQGWKDSGDAVVDEDGGPVPAPIAPCEIQGYWFAAQQLMAVLEISCGDRRAGRAHWRSSRSLAKRFDRDFWDPAERFYGLALGPDKRLLRVVTSNVGHCLATGIVPHERRREVAERLLAPDMFSGWGVRTLSTAHPAYNPLSYHLGSVWAVENATICFGLRRFGFDAEALRLAEALFALAELYGGDRIPETVGGYAPHEHPTPGAYPRSNTPQTWNASALPLVLQSLLGLVPYAPLHTLFVDPRLPAWLPEVVLTGLRVGTARVTLRFWRDRRGRSHSRVLHETGKLRLVRQPPPEARRGWRPRVRALFERTPPV
jgi:glycogen debranching enzyme